MTLAVIVGGIWSLSRINLDAVPDVTNNQVQVITQAPNLGAQEMEQFIAYPIEMAMANLPGVIEIRSISRFGLSVVTIVFEDRMGTYLPRQLIGEKLEEVRKNIPEGMGEVSMGPIATGLGEIYQYTLAVDPDFEDHYDIMELRTIQDWIVKRQMAMVPGVIEVNSFGGETKQYEVAVAPHELDANGLTILDIYDALKANNQNTGGAYIERNSMANFIRGEGLATNKADIENIVVSTDRVTPVRIKDVATVKFGAAVRYGAFTSNGKGEAVGGIIFMLKGANSNSVIGNVKKRMEQIQQSLPEGVVMQPFLDRSELISRTTGTIQKNLIEGALIVIFVLVFLLGNWRGGLIVASTIPLSLLFAFILMNVFDVWANLMSLGAIDFGIIVDGAVIIVESTVFSLHQKAKKGNALNQKTRDKITFKASSKMMNAAFFGQLTILIVFLPILFLEGIEGKMFKPMALTFMFAMMGATILCLTYVPMISSLFIRVRSAEKASWGDKVMHWVEEKYDYLLHTALRRKALIIGVSGLLLVLTLFTFLRLGGEFIPQLDEGDIAFHILLKPGSSLAEGIKTSTQIERVLLDNFPEIEQVHSRFGVAEVPTDPMPMDMADCFIILKPKEEWVSAKSKDELIDKIKEKLQVITGINMEFSQPIEMRFNELISGVREDVAIKIFGEDLSILASKAEEVGRLVANIPGVADLKIEAISGLPQMTVTYHRDLLAQFGVSIRDINTLIQTAFAGGKAGLVYEGDRRFDLVVRLDTTYRKGIEDLENLFVPLGNGNQVPLRQLADVRFENGPMQISRDDTQRRTYVGINVRGRDIKSLVQEIETTLKEKLILPPGYFIRYGGAFENLERATKRLQIVVPVSLALIFFLIFLALGSFKQAAMIYVAIPLAAIGGVFSLWMRGMPFSISAGLGFIVAFGVAVLDGLVLTSTWNELKKEGIKDLDQRIKSGAKRRIRPIMLTALTDIFGFLPMALSKSAGAEVQQPLATVVIGGMITSTLLNLFVLPILYRWVEARNFRFTKGGAITLLLVCFLAVPFSGLHAQEATGLYPIAMKEAVERAMVQYPQLKAARLKIEQEESLKKTAWDMGNTTLFSAGDEVGEDGQGVFTPFGIMQQNINIFGVGPKLAAQKQRVALSEIDLTLNGLEIRQQVQTAYAMAYVQANYVKLYTELDSIYQGFERAANIRFEVEEISKLGYLAAVNQSRQMSLQKEQADYDMAEALIRLNLWLVSDTVFSVDLSDDSWIEFRDANHHFMSHPLMQWANQNLNLAQAEKKAAQAGLLPQIQAQYGPQIIDRSRGFLQYQFGLTVPLFFVAQKGRIQAAHLQTQIAQQQYQQTQMEIMTQVQALQQQYHKWYSSWLFYQNDALPLAREQRRGAVLAFQEGEIDYVALIQTLNQTLQVEVNALEALENYLQNHFQLEYYINSDL